MREPTFCGFSMGRNQYWAGRLYVLCVYFMTGTPEGSTESGFMEKPGIKQGIALIHYTKNFLWLSLGRNQYRREGLWFVCLLYDGSTRRLTESGFNMWFYGEAGNRTCDPWFTRHSAYPLHHGRNQGSRKVVLEQSVTLHRSNSQYI